METLMIIVTIISTASGLASLRVMILQLNTQKEANKQQQTLIEIQESQKDAEIDRREIKEKLDEIQNYKRLEYGDYINNKIAYGNAVDDIENIINEQNGRKATIDVKFLTIGMKNSYADVFEPIIRLLNTHDNISFTIQILLVSPKYIEDILKVIELEEWATYSSTAIANIRKNIDELPKLSISRLDIEVKTYNSIPQYHGIIINDEHLYQGTTSWEFSNNSVKLSVGDDKYMYFNKSGNHDTVSNKEHKKDHVKLFLQWHRFYFDLNSAKVFHYIHGEFIENNNNFLLSNTN